jgi:hypothetical protein
VELWVVLCVYCCVVARALRDPGIAPAKTVRPLAACAASISRPPRTRTNWTPWSLHDPHGFLFYLFYYIVVHISDSVFPRTTCDLVRAAFLLSPQSPELVDQPNSCGSRLNCPGDECTKSNPSWSGSGDLKTATMYSQVTYMRNVKTIK